MPSSSDNRSNNFQPPQRDRDRQPRGAARDEPRDFETQVSDNDRNYNAPFDSALEPTEDKDINTHGSER